jgi:death on curing protein
VIGRVSCRYVELADFLVTAEAVLGVPAETLARSARLHLAESALAAPAAEYGGEEFYPDLHLKAAVLCARLARNHPLTDGNKRTAFLLMLEFLWRNGLEWHRGPGDPTETVDMIERAAAGTLPEDVLARWLASRTAG